MQDHTVSGAPRAVNPFTPLTIKTTSAVIHLTREKRSLVDAEMWPVLSLHLWQAKADGPRWYAVTTINGRMVGMHQILCPCRSGYVPDHKNRNGLDNRRSNLRPATRQQNGANSVGVRKRSNTGYRGAYWDKSKERFVAKIMVEGKLRSLGHFNTPEDAARAYDDAARSQYGEFAQTNFSN